MNTELVSGLLKDCYDKIKGNIFDNISAQNHKHSYEGEHDLSFAEPEFSGKYLDICMAYYYNEADKKAMDNAKIVIDAIIKAQRSDGYLGMYMKGLEFGSFSVWNQAFTMFGMLKYYEATKEEKVLKSAEKCALYNIESFKTRDILEATNCGSQNLVIALPIAMLFKITGKSVYKEFIVNLKEYLKQSKLNLINPENILELQSRKGIEILAAYVGFLEYARYVGDDEIICGAKKYYEQLKDTQIRNTGGGSTFELWTESGNTPAFLPENVKPNENCVTVGWIELCMELFYIEQDAQYLDNIETALFNHELAAISKSFDDFCYYQPNFGKKNQGTGENMYSCCRYRGITLFSHLRELLYFDNNKEIIPLIFTSSVHENSSVRIVQKTDYPKDGVIEFTVIPKKKTEFDLKLRLPKWCKSSRIFIDEKEIFLTPCSGFDKYFDNYFVIGRMWEKETHIRYELQMTPRVETVNIFDSEFCQITYGPLVLAVDSAFGKKPQDICFNQDGAEFKREDSTDEIVRFTTQGFTLVDYASAGTKNPDTDEFSIWIKQEG